MKLQNLSILVTGGAGFIGSHLVETLSKNNKVTVYDNFSSSVITPREVSKLKNIRAVRGDIRDASKLAQAIKGIDIVFHLAVACVRLSLKNPTFVHDVNATGTLNTLLASKNSGVKRFIYISSSEVYGTAQKPKIDESHPINPTTVYGMSKFAGEQYARLFHEHEGLETIIVRPFNTYGPRSHFDGVYGEVIPRFMVRSLCHLQPIIFGQGDQQRDFTYVTDTVLGICKAAASEKLAGQTINIAYGQGVSIHTLAKTICTLSSLTFKPIRKTARPNDVKRHTADIKKAASILSYQPIVAINEGLDLYRQWLTQKYSNPKALLSLIPETNW